MRSRRAQRRQGDAAPGQKAGAPRDGFILTVVDGPHSGKEVYFDKTITLGRVEENDLVMVEPGISRYHARIFQEGGVYMLEDMGSANGTRLNGEKLEEQEVLKDGDYISLAGATFQYSFLAANRGEVTARTAITEVQARAIDARATHAGSVGSKLKFLRSRKGMAVAAAVVLLLVIGGYFATRHGGEGKPSSNESNVPLEYSDEETFFSMVYGYGKYDLTHPDKVMLDFEYLGGRVTLQYGAWGVDRVGEVVIQLNDKQVAKLPATMSRWVYGLKQVLPRDKLKKGKNRITFDNTDNPPGENQWEICYLQLLQEAIPPPDRQEAQTQFELAKKAWEDREIEPSNSHKALERFKRARDLLEGLKDKPALYRDALDFIKKVDKALTRRFSEGIFSARRAQKLDSNTDKAKSILLRTRRYFQKEDFRYREIQRYLDELSAQ